MRIVHFILSKSICNSSLSLHQLYINSWFWKYLKKPIEHIGPYYDKIQMHTSHFSTPLLLGKEERNRMDIQYVPASSEWSLPQDPRAWHEALPDIWPTGCNTSDGWQLWHWEWCSQTPTLLITSSESVAKMCMHSLNLCFVILTWGTHGLTYFGALFLRFLCFMIFHIILFTS